MNARRHFRALIAALSLIVTVPAYADERFGYGDFDPVSLSPAQIARLKYLLNAQLVAENSNARTVAQLRARLRNYQRPTTAQD